MTKSEYRGEPASTIASAITRGGAISLNSCLSGYSQSLETTRAVRLTLTSTTYGEPRFARETFSGERKCA
jgi:hypothetical protein